MGTNKLDKLPVLQYFSYTHLTNDELRDISANCANLAYQMVEKLDAGPELAAGLRKLLEAKDCFVRAALDLSGIE